MSYANQKIKDAAKKAKLYQWEIALEIGVSELRLFDGYGHHCLLKKKSASWSPLKSWQRRRNKMTTNFPTMNTITQAAATSGLAVYRVRQLCQSGRIKSIRCGRRILVNMDSLAAYLNEGDAVQPAPAVGGIRRADES